MSDHYDREGRPVELMEWAELHKDQDYLRVARTVVGRSLLVSTVWLGLDHQWGQGPPLIFETMVFARWNFAELAMWRYSTEVEARAGHVDAALWARQRYHGLVKHARDERRERMKRDMELLAYEDDSGDELADELVKAGKLMRRLPRHRPM